MQFPNVGSILGNFIASSRRILTISNKPDKSEFWFMAKVTGLGMVLLGVLGFIITFIFHFLVKV